MQGWYIRYGTDKVWLNKGLNSGICDKTRPVCKYYLDWSQTSIAFDEVLERGVDTFKAKANIEEMVATLNVWHVDSFKQVCRLRVGYVA
jgi:hypothetical protein